MMTNMPVYEAKAELFRTLGHPTRIRVLELLSQKPHQVRELLAAIDVEASNLSQQLAVLRRVGLVTSARHGAVVVYELSTPALADLLAAGRHLLAERPDTPAGLRAELRDAAS